MAGISQQASTSAHGRASNLAGASGIDAWLRADAKASKRAARAARGERPASAPARDRGRPRSGPGTIPERRLISNFDTHRGDRPGTGNQRWTAHEGETEGSDQGGVAGMTPPAADAFPSPGPDRSTTSAPELTQGR
jgi:hypothetical protein